MSQITVNLSPTILALLRGKGLSQERAAQLLNATPRQSARLLLKAGARLSGGKWGMGK